MTVQRDPSGMKYVRKPIDYLTICKVNISGLLQLVQRLGSKAWEREDAAKENKFEVLGQTQHIVFRFTKENADPRVSYSNPSWDIWKPHLIPIMDLVTSHYDHKQTAYSKVMLARMPSGGRIDQHVDGKGSNLTTHKVHVPLITNPQALFHVNGVTRHLEIGYAFEVNNIVKHGGENQGDTDRVHLIFEHFDAAASPHSSEDNTP